jgi:hypothetical protein
VNKIIESTMEEDLTVPQDDIEWQKRDFDTEEFDIAAAISDAHDDPC